MKKLLGLAILVCAIYLPKPGIYADKFKYYIFRNIFSMIH